MKRSRLLAVLTALIVAGATWATDTLPGPDARFVDAWILVRLRSPLEQRVADGSFSLQTGVPSLDALILEEGVHRIDHALSVTMEAPRNRAALARHGLDRIYKLHVPEGADIPRLVALFSRLPGVDFAEPDFIDRRFATVPNDPLFSTQWAHRQATDADIDGPEAWDITVGGPTILGILDSGIDSNHSDLSGNLPGFDFFNGDNDPEDDNGHGTSVCSVAAADTNNSTGIAGTCWNCRILPVKVANAFGDATTANFADGVAWATDQGARALNYSAGGSHNDTRLAAVRYAYDAGVVMVAATGNGGGVNAAFPSRYVETIAVGGSNELDELSEFSTYGRALDVLAPSVNITAASFTGGYESVNGTSFAAPFVTGLAGLIESVHPSVGREEVRDLVRFGAEDQVGLVDEDLPGWDNFHGWGRINLHRTLQGAEAATTLRVEGSGATRVFYETPSPIATSFDFVRGNLASLSETAAGVDLGSVVCLENDSVDADTVGNEDLGTPAPGEAFFYAARANSGPWPGSYGGSSSHRDRTSPLPASSAAWILEQTFSEASFGAAIASAGDVDGDGYDDVIVGARDIATGGAAYVYMGSGSGLAPTPTWDVTSTQLGSSLGSSVSGLGDVNGDGYDDVIVGEFGYDGAIGNNEGRALVYLGSSSGLPAFPHRTLRDPQQGARYGFRVRGAGDVDGDGYDDVIVGAPRYDGPLSNEGRAYLYMGSGTGLAASPAWSYESNQANAEAGADVGPAGDINGDGYDDVLVGASLYDAAETDQGRVWLFHGSGSGLNVAPAVTLEIDLPDIRFGLGAHAAGDVDNDTYDDIVVTAFRYTDGELREGAAFVYRGSSAGLITTPAWSFETGTTFAFLESARSAGDVDGDGYDDLIVGSENDRTNRVNEGRAWLFRGSTSGLSATAAWSEVGRQAQANFGFAVAGAGDIDGDGYDDVVVGAPGQDSDKYNTGRVYVYRGSPTGLSSTPTPACDGP